MDKNYNEYNPPNLKENKTKIEPFDIIETKQRKPIIPNIPSVQKIIKNQSNNNNNKEENTLKSVMIAVFDQLQQRQYQLLSGVDVGHPTAFYCKVGGHT